MACGLPGMIGPRAPSRVGEAPNHALVSVITPNPSMTEINVVENWKTLGCKLVMNSFALVSTMCEAISMNVVGVHPV